MKESRSRAKDGPDSTSDPMAEMRARYDRAVEADSDNRKLALEDLKFVTIPGNQWDKAQKDARKGRPCYEFPILRSHWRQVVNDQKKARPGIKVRAVEDSDGKGAELRQGIIRNIESVSNAERAYDAAFESLTACGFGAWRVAAEYSTDDGWDQDLRVKRITDPLSSVWFDPDAKEADCRDAKYAFVEESISRDEFKAKYPKAEAVDFDSHMGRQCSGWYGKDHIRIAEYHRMVPITRKLLLLSDGRTVDAADLTPEKVQEMGAQGITVKRERDCKGHKAVMSIVAGNEEIDGPHDSVFSRIPIIPVYANRHFIEGRWHWAGMVRFSRDPQKLLNYNLTTAQEVLAKQPKAPYILTPKMLEGAGVKKMWDNSNAVDTPYLPITPDPLMPNGPQRLPPPQIAAAFVQMGEIATDMLKASDGIFDASVGARSNETSGKAILARQQQGDTATFDYQDALGFGIQATGEILLSALPKVYDTPRAMRVLGKDGGEDWQQLYEEVQDPQTGQMKVINDLSSGKYDVTVTTGPSFDTQRMEFVEMLTSLGQNNPAIAAGVPDLIVGSLDFPKAEEAAERMKLLLPPPIQQMLAEGKDTSPEMQQMKGQLQQVQQQAEQMQQEMGQALQQAQQKAGSNEAAMLKAQNDERRLEIDWFSAETARLAVLQKDGHANDALQFKALQEMGRVEEADASRQFQAQGQQAERDHQAAQQFSATEGA